MKSLSQLHLFATTTFSCQRRNPTSENFSQRSNFPFSLSFSLSLPLSPRSGLSSHGTLDREQLPVSRKSIAEERVENQKRERKKEKENSPLPRLRLRFSFNLRAELLAYARFVSRFRRIARRFVSSLIARGEKGREESRVCQSCGCRGGIGTAVHGSVRPTASTKHLCSNINTGNRGDSQSLLGFVTPVAEFTRLPGGYPYTVFADTSPRTCNLYAVHAHAFPTSLARFDI